MDRSQLNKATSDSPTPPPGYIYTEISKWTHNNPSVNQSLEKYLIARIKNKSPFVKWKVCLIIKHTSPKANVGFKRAMQRHTDVIKACMQFRGPPHATLGDSPYVNVRTEAKAAVEAIFAESTNAQVQGLKSKITSMGSNGSGNSGQQQQHAAFSGSGGGRYDTNISSISNHSGGGRYGNNSGGGGGRAQMGAEGTAGPGSYRGNTGRAMVGHGNPNFVDPRKKKPGFFDKMKNSAFGGKQKEAAKPAFMNSPTGAVGYNYASNRGPNSSDKTYGAPSARNVPGSSTGTGYINSVQSPARRNSGARKMGGVGGSWGGEDDIPLGNNNNRYNKSGSNTGSGDNNNNTGSSLSCGRAGTARSDGVYETQLVDNICAPGGLRPRPPANDVKKFISRCQTLDAEMMAGLLVDRVCSEDWTVSAKALIVVEELAKEESLSSFADYFYDHKDVFEDEMEESDQKLIRDRARKVLITLGVEGLESSSTNSKRRGKGRTALPEITRVDNVLSGGIINEGEQVFGGDDDVTTQQPQQTTTTTSDSDDLLGMFGGESAPVAPSQKTDDTQVASTISGGSGFGSMFDGLGSSSSTTTPDSATPEPVAPSSGGGGGFDFMSAPSTSTPTYKNPDSGSLLLPSNSTPAPSSTQNNVNMMMNMSISSAFDGLDVTNGKSAATSSNFAFAQNAQQRNGGNNIKVNDPLAGLSGIASSQSNQVGLLGMNFSSTASNQASQQQKMQQVLAAQQMQQRNVQNMQYQQRGGIGGGMMGKPIMGMSGMGGIRQMQPGANQPLPDFNALGGGMVRQQQPAQQQKKQNASFGFVNDMLA